MSQQGVTFLEVIVVIAILMITTSMVSPAISDWRQRRALESDFHAVLVQVDYLKTRARAISGTASLSCSALANGANALAYKISTAPQADVLTLGPLFTANVLEDPVLQDPGFNVLSGRTKIVSEICKGKVGIFVSSGQSGVEGGNGAIDLLIEPIASKSQYGSYRVLVNQTTGYIQKFKRNGADVEVELE